MKIKTTVKAGPCGNCHQAVVSGAAGSGTAPIDSANRGVWKAPAGG